ncbi:hypothetical protein [Paraburkholderia bryophila]|uniref:Uncharacterized protein n=1 Tax=Paraburkholderia bryophila TaxID=420952 RepID=A0A329CWJ8_9BURK|nr:hypothetical protein [Paraburkholderia bryophila]RAS38302.1 hypothetical protein BX591_102598 [Paraburkholderia bryophila]
MSTETVARSEQSSDNPQLPSSRSVRDTELSKCYDTINGIDSMCQIQLGQIENLTSVTLRAMESPGFWKGPTALGEILGLIQYIAADLGNYVNAVAEEVGSNHVDEIGRARDRRVLAAFCEAHPKGDENV